MQIKKSTLLLFIYIWWGSRIPALRYTTRPVNHNTPEPDANYTLYTKMTIDGFAWRHLSRTLQQYSGGRGVLSRASVVDSTLYHAWVLGDAFNEMKNDRVN